MLKLERAGKHEWRFIYFPQSKYCEVMDKFDEGVDLWEAGHIRSAKKIYKEVIEEFPEFIDAYHHLGLTYEVSGKDRLALDSWVKGYQIGRRALPSNFTPGRDLLEWGWLENRPFLRCTHALVKKKLPLC